MVQMVLLLLGLLQLSWEQEARPTYKNCAVPENYPTQLNIVPVPRAYSLYHGEVITVMCRTSGFTFMNHMYTVEGVSTADIFFNSYILIECKDGSLQPNIFLQTQWCDKGCSKFPDSYTTSYGFTPLSRRYNPLRQYGKLEAPVTADPLYLVTFKCSPGYSKVSGDSGESAVRCTETGYDKRPIQCSPGCPVPFNVKNALLNKTGLLAANSAGSELAPYTVGTVLNVDCDVTDPSNKFVTISCVRNKGWEGLSGLEAYSNCKESSVVAVVPSDSETENENESTGSATFLYETLNDFKNLLLVLLMNMLYFL